MDYKQRQKRWVAENGIVVGSRVRIGFAVPSYFGGWQNSWVYGMDAFVGELGYISKIGGTGGVYVSRKAKDFWFPYMCLEVAGPQPESPPLTGEDSDLVIRVLKEVIGQMSTKGSQKDPVTGPESVARPLHAVD